MASPHTAGAVALLYSGCPGFIGQMDGTFDILQASTGAAPDGTCGAPQDGEGNYTFGYGYLDAFSLVQSCLAGIGTLNGHVADAATGSPIAGAKVTARTGTQGNGVDAVTDPNGFYTMILAAGDYDVTAAKDEYFPQTVNGVLVAAGQTTTQDLTLQALPPPFYLFQDDMENGPGNWLHQSDPGYDDWAIVNDQSHSPTHSWFTADVGWTSDKRLWTLNPVTIPTGAEFATLGFWHNYSFEYTFDGGVIEISTDGGANWADLGGNVLTNGYNSTLSTMYGNPLGGRLAWSGSSNGWLKTKVNLLPFQGMSVQVRFRLGTDESFSDTGWYIDDVAFYVQGALTENRLHLNKAKMNWAPAARPGMYKVVWTGRIHDQDDVVLGGVTLLGRYTYPDGSVVDKLGTTNNLGTVKFPVKVSQTGQFQFCVTALAKSGYLYDPGADESPACKTVTVTP